MTPPPATETPCIVYVCSTSIHLARTRLPLLRHMRRAGWRVIAAAPADAGTPRLTAAGIEWVPLPIVREIARPVRHLRTYRALRRLYRTVQPALVHHFTANALIYGGLAAWRSGAPPMVQALPGLGVFASRRRDAHLLRIWLHAAYRIATRLPNSRTVFQNPDDLAALVDTGIVPRARAVLIRSSGIDLDVFRPVAEPPGTPVVLFCGRLLASKGVHDLIAAARLLRERRVPCVIRLVGRIDPTHRDAVAEDTLRDAVARGLIEWDGARDDMAAVYAAAHIVVLPSYREGVPRVLIEGAACGRALVATDVPGCREIVVHERTGLLVPPRDPPRLADALARLIGAPAERLAFGRAAHALAVSAFGTQAVIDATVALYRELLGDTPPRRALTPGTHCDSPSTRPRAAGRA